MLLTSRSAIRRRSPLTHIWRLDSNSSSRKPYKILQSCLLTSVQNSASRNRVMGRRRREMKDTGDDNTNKGKRRKAEEDGNMAEQQRWPLAEVVTDCTERWFEDTLKEAKAGDVNMQVLVGQMYYSGYGASKDAEKGKFWITRASRVRSSVWKVSQKRPGYNASDSDSDDVVDDDS